MALGPGKYDDLATFCLTQSHAQAVVLIVFNGNRGSGISGKEMVSEYEIVLHSPLIQEKLPSVLRKVADDIERGA